MVSNVGTEFSHIFSMTDCSLYISKRADKENLFANQKVPSLVIISFILMTFMCDSGVIL